MSREAHRRTTPPADWVLSVSLAAPKPSSMRDGCTCPDEQTKVIGSEVLELLGEIGKLGRGHWDFLHAHVRDCVNRAYRDAIVDEYGQKRMHGRISCGVQSRACSPNAEKTEMFWLRSTRK